MAASISVETAARGAKNRAALEFFTGSSVAPSVERDTKDRKHEVIG